MKKQNQYNKNLKVFARRLRKEGTPGEAILWKKVLRARKLHGYQFNRQFPIGNYIVDFICRKLHLVIEVDGYSHNFTFDKDLARDKYLNDLGFTVLRFKEKDIVYNLNDIIRVLENYAEETAPLAKGD